MQCIYVTKNGSLKNLIGRSISSDRSYCFIHRCVESEHGDDGGSERQYLDCILEVSFDNESLAIVCGENATSEMIRVTRAMEEFLEK